MAEERKKKVRNGGSDERRMGKGMKEGGTGERKEG